MKGDAEKKNTYSFNFNNKQIVLRPFSPEVMAAKQVKMSKKNELKSQDNPQSIEQKTKQEVEKKEDQSFLFSALKLERAKYKSWSWNWNKWAYETKEFGKENKKDFVLGKGISEKAVKIGM